VRHGAAHVLNYQTLAQPLEQSLFGTPAGLSGVILMGAFALMWFFALGFMRRSGRFEAFFFSHLLYVVFFAVALFHAPNFWKWASAPMLWFFVELLLKRGYKRRETFVQRSRVLPHGVTHLQLHRPEGLRFQAGDYLFLKLPSISRFEWHPFTISSGPEEAGFVGVHIRSLGNWTRAVHRTFEQRGRKTVQVPAAINGPYGTPSGRIFRSPYAVLIGAGIGVTPFASILSSLLHRRQSGGELAVKKVYFFWLNRGRKSFQWFAELLAEIEAQKLDRFLSLHIYMTDAALDPTTGLVKVGIDLLGKERAEDLTTGLKTITEFGRPDWPVLFADISRRHRYRAVNVFYCGPTPLGWSIRDAARHVGFGFRNEVF
jgi:predicted ferric reductase